MMPEDDRPASNRTVFRPSPLAAAGASAPAGQAPAAPAADMRPPAPVASALTDDVPPLALPPQPRNPVMAVAARLLTLAAAVQAERQVADPAGLLRTATAEAKAFEKALTQIGLSAEDNARARYAVLATLDDIVQNLPGGSTSDWARQSLVVQSFGQAFGGDQFWTILDNMLARPAAYRDLLELYQACLAVGFQGRYRVAPDARAQLTARIDAIFAAMGDARARPETDLVPQWRGVPTPVRKVGWAARLALAAAATLAALLIVFFAMKLWLDGRDDAPQAALRRIPALAPVRIDRAGGDLPVKESGQLVRIRGRLHSDCIKAQDDGATVRLVVSACPGLPAGMFEAGAADLAEAYRALVIEAGAALKPEPGEITVAAHTDSDAIRGTLAASYPDNAALSLARARNAVAVLAPSLGADRLTAVGRGDREPVDRSGSAAGKARNRRVELIIPRTGE